MEKQKVLTKEEIKGGEKMKPILVVEDETITREALRDWLTYGGYQVETAEEGEKALEAIAEQDFGIVILDLKLPGKDGIEVLKEAKEKRPQLKGVIITAYPSVETAVKATKEGALDYLPKPFDLNQLEKLIRDTLGAVQVEIKPKAALEKVEEVVTVTPEEIPAHLERGKEFYKAGHYQEALKEFEAILKVAPSDVQARFWRQAAKDKLTGSTQHKVQPAKPVNMESVERTKLAIRAYRARQAEIKETEAEPAMVEEVVTIAPEEIPVRLKQGKEFFEASRYQEALKEFEAILRVAPGNIETRVWIRKAKEALEAPRVEAVAEGEAAPAAEEAKPKECLWMKMGLVSYRLCTRNYDCLTCEFDQMMQDKMASGQMPELDAALEKFKELPGNQRLCRYALKGDVSYRLCTRAFRCATCEFGQMMEDAMQQKVAKLAARRQALLKKAQQVETKA
jgi:DNA-binding response OmpR family regulator